jgi:hypothetical protein
MKNFLFFINKCIRNIKLCRLSDAIHTLIVLKQTTQLTKKKIKLVYTIIKLKYKRIVGDVGGCNKLLQTNKQMR